LHCDCAGLIISFNLASSSSTETAAEEPSTLESIQKGVDAGNPDSQFALASMYATGTEILPKNDGLAYAFFRKAADQGHMQARFNVGVAFVNGRGVAQNDQSAFEYFFKAAEQGYGEAQFLTGFCFDKGKGTQADPKKAIHFYQLASDQGNQRAIQALAALRQKSI
jgi:TPR repeat protein